MASGKYKPAKTLLVAGLMFLLSSSCTQAQSIAQLIEQLTLDIQKLSQLKTILKDMQDGYQVLDKGYTNIREIVHGNFSLHKAFLDGLLDVSPPVRQYYKVAQVMDNERSIVTECQAAGRRWAASGLFTPGELEYIGQLYRKVSDRNSQCLDRLTMVITADELRMSDAERIQAIDRIHADIAGLLQGLRRYNDGLTMQTLQRARELQNIQALKSIYGNHP